MHNGDNKRQDPGEAAYDDPTLGPGVTRREFIEMLRSYQVLGSANDGTLLALSAQGHVSGLNAATGAQLWTASQVEQGGIPASVLDGNVYVSNLAPASRANSVLTALDTGNGKALWTANYEASDVAASGGLLYAVRGAANPNTGTTVLNAITESTGAVAWTFDTHSSDVAAIALG